MDAAEYKHFVLGMIFLKYISDAFQERHDALKADKHADAEDRDEYTAENVFWVPKVAPWPALQAAAKQPTIGKLLDDAMVAIEKANPSLKGSQLVRLYLRRVKQLALLVTRLRVLRQFGGLSILPTNG